MKKTNLSLITILHALLLFFFTQTIFAQTCITTADLAQLAGKYIDAAHNEWPQQKAHWLDQLKTPTNKASATAAFTKIETWEAQSRKNYALKGADLKMSFGTPSNANSFFGKKQLFAYDLNLGCYEFFCYKGSKKVSDEYSIVFRANINRLFPGVNAAFTFSEDYPYYEIYNQYNGKFITLCQFLLLDTTKTKINNSKGYYQDISESTIKPGDRSILITRHWYYTKKDMLPFVPVTRKEYLEALLEYYDREARYTADKIKEIEKEAAGMMKDPVKYPQLYENGKKNLIAKKAKYPDWQQRIETKKKIVQKALQENSAGWLAQPAVIKSKRENFSWKNYYGNGANDYVTVDGYYTDTPEDAKNTGAFTFSGFWDDKGGTILYKCNEDYFKGAEKNPAKPYLIELTYRYINTPLGKSLVENFTENFDFDAVRSLVE